MLGRSGQILTCCWQGRGSTDDLRTSGHGRELVQPVRREVRLEAVLIVLAPVLRPAGLRTELICKFHLRRIDAATLQQNEGILLLLRLDRALVPDDAAGRMCSGPRHNDFLATTQVGCLVDVECHGSPVDDMLLVVHEKLTADGLGLGEGPPTGTAGSGGSGTTRPDCHSECHGDANCRQDQALDHRSPSRRLRDNR